MKIMNLKYGSTKSNNVLPMSIDGYAFTQKLLLAIERTVNKQSTPQVYAIYALMFYSRLPYFAFFSSSTTNQMVLFPYFAFLF